MCEQLQINYGKLSEQDREAFKKVMKKSGYYKDYSLVSWKKR